MTALREENKNLKGKTTTQLTIVKKLIGEYTKPITHNHDKKGTKIEMKTPSLEF